MAKWLRNCWQTGVGSRTRARHFYRATQVSALPVARIPRHGTPRPRWLEPACCLPDGALLAGKCPAGREAPYWPPEPGWTTLTVRILTGFEQPFVV
jgi:hypothetical protein